MYSFFIVVCSYNFIGKSLFSDKIQENQPTDHVQYFSTAQIILSGHRSETFVDLATFVVILVSMCTLSVRSDELWINHYFIVEFANFPNIVPY